MNEALSYTLSKGGNNRQLTNKNKEKKMKKLLLSGAFILVPIVALAENAEVPIHRLIETAPPIGATDLSKIASLLAGATGKSPIEVASLLAGATATDLSKIAFLIEKAPDLSKITPRLAEAIGEVDLNSLIKFLKLQQVMIEVFISDIATYYGVNTADIVLSFYEVLPEGLTPNELEKLTEIIKTATARVSDYLLNKPHKRMALIIASIPFSGATRTEIEEVAKIVKVSKIRRVSL